MVYGFNRGKGGRAGSGFGFRGSSPPNPYIGRGRGGLPRCAYPGLNRTVIPYTANAPLPNMSTPEEELKFLKGQAETIKRQLVDIERRMQELEKKD